MLLATLNCRSATPRQTESRRIAIRFGAADALRERAGAGEQMQ